MRYNLLKLCFFSSVLFASLFMSCSDDDNVVLDDDVDQSKVDNDAGEETAADDSTNDDTESVEGFSKNAMLTNWADNIIIPSFQALVNKLDSLSLRADAFSETPNEENLIFLRQSWEDAYMAWQTVDMFDIGKAEEITFRNYMNVYPLNAQDMKATLLAGDYDLTSINRQDEQGFSALDYLLFGLADSDIEILAYYTDVSDGAKYKTFLTDVVDRMQSLTITVLADWKDSYRDEFIERDGSSATASVNSMVNDYIYYYEKFLRAGKVGIPAGIFSNTPLSDRVEARYKANFSKKLLSKALHSSQDFFNGVHFEKEDAGLSLKGWINHIEETNNTNNLDSLINNQFELIYLQLDNMSDNFATQVENDNLVMLQTYDIIQKNVILLKVEMLQFLDITVDYVDADGD